MHIFFEPDITTSHRLNAAESKHAVNVLRLKSGDKIFVADGKGHIYSADIVEAHSSKTTVTRLRLFQTTQLQRRIAIAIGITRQAERLEWFVEKATEIGVRDIILMITHNTARHKLNVERLQRVAITAMKQSGNAHLPNILGPRKLIELLGDDSFDSKYVCNGNALDSLPKIDRDKTSSVIACIGPEGDFTDEEMRLFEQYQYTSVSLGPTRLRTETAAIVAAAALALS